MPNLPIHIVTPIAGQTDVNFMIIEIIEKDIDAIRDARKFIRSFTERYGAWQRIEHFNIRLILLSGFPEGFGFGLGLDEEDAEIDEPAVLPLTPDESFIAAAEKSGKIYGSECDRLRIDSLGRIEAACYVKHDDELLVSSDLAPILAPILHPLA